MKPSDFAIVVLALIFALLFIALGVAMGDSRTQREAVKAGAAQWVTTTNEDGSPKTEFKWIVPIEKK